jgi:hypothetical protein
MAMNLFPYHTGDVPKPESRGPREDSSGDHDSEEIPEPAHERATRQLLAEQAPCEWCDTDKSHEEPDIGRKVLYRGPAQVVELGKNTNPASNTP